MDPAEPVRRAVQDAIERCGETGLQVAAYLHGEPLLAVSGGWCDATRSAAVTDESLFPVFSVTKAVTATALHVQAERGLVDYDAPIAHYWPEFARHGKAAATVRDALEHRTGLPMMPHDVTPERMCDWDWVVERLADMHPLHEPGSRQAYHSYSFGWLVGEIVRRTDPRGRHFSDFVREEIAGPLRVDDLWVGLPAEHHHRVVTLTDAPRTLPADAEPLPPGSLFAVTIPPAVGLGQRVYGRADVRSACLPGSGGMMTARSVARFLAMLAQGGTLDGVRLLSPERVAAFSRPGRPCAYDPVVGRPNNISHGFHLAEPLPGNEPCPNMAPARGGPASSAIRVAAGRSAGPTPTPGCRRPSSATGSSATPSCSRRTTPPSASARRSAPP